MREPIIFHLLRGGRFSEGVVRGFQHGDKYLRFRGFAGGGVDDRNGLAAVVNEHLFTVALGLPHREPQMFLPLIVENEKLRVAVSPRSVLLTVFFPQKLAGHAFEPQLIVNGGEVR